MCVRNGAKEGVEERNPHYRVRMPNALCREKQSGQSVAGSPPWRDLCGLPPCDRSEKKQRSSGKTPPGVHAAHGGGGIGARKASDSLVPMQNRTTLSLRGTEKSGSVPVLCAKKEVVFHQRRRARGGVSRQTRARRRRGGKKVPKRGKESCTR